MPWMGLENYRRLQKVIDLGLKVRVVCTVCREIKDFSRDDLLALKEKVGPDFSFVDRRCRCRITPGCTGWNRFTGLQGVYRPLWHPDVGVMWSLKDRYGPPPRS